MSVLEKIPAKVRLALYLLYAVAGPVLVYTAAKGYTGTDEYTLYVGVGTALGLTAAANIRTRRRLAVEDVPHETVVAADVVIVADKPLDPEGP
jgi:hypothetical protein